MSGATYKYSINADSGYKSDQSGKITPERHGVVCAALDGGLSDDLFILKAAPDLLEALEAFERIKDIWLPAEAEEQHAEEMYALHMARANMLAAIARAKGEA